MAAFRNPAPTVDAVILLPGDRVVLVRRRNPPHGWAIPGGFVDEGEPLDGGRGPRGRGGDRALASPSSSSSTPTRTRPATRAATPSARSSWPAPPGEPRGGDDAAEARAFAWDALPDPIVFDHREILADVRRYLLTGARRRL